MEKGEAARVFISYRRQETAWPARQLYDVLVAELGADRVFKDVVARHLVRFGANDQLTVSWTP